MEDTNAEIRRGLAVLAALINGTNPPVVSTDMVSSLVIGVRDSQQSAKRSLTRREAREALMVIEKAAKSILACLKEATVRDALLVASEYDYAAMELLEPTILKLHSVAQTAPSFFLKGQAGSARAALRAGLTAKEVCAFAIMEAWLVARNSYPGVNNQDAHSAAALLWELSGNESPGKSEAPDWSRQFRNVTEWAKKPKNAEGITVFRRNFQPRAEG